MKGLTQYKLKETEPYAIVKLILIGLIVKVLGKIISVYILSRYIRKLFST